MPHNAQQPDAALPVAAYVAVGSNIQPEINIPRALELLQKHVHVTATSTFFRSAAQDRPGQQPFANGVWKLWAAMSPRQLKFDILRPIEAQLGRRRQGDKFADRTIDLDLILYGQCMMDEPELKLPDPGIFRPFGAVPLLERAADLVVPPGQTPLARRIRSGDREGLEALTELTAVLRTLLQNVEGSVP
jgi:2-amino-4-hydroxy-6-hydroxymethyldihydropteridine diphosphokinase